MSNPTMSMEVAAALLGISVSASREEVEKAYRMRARLLHPDRFEANSSSYSAAEESMKQLNMAKETMVFYIANPQTKESPKASPSQPKPTSPTNNSNANQTQRQEKPNVQEETAEEYISRVRNHWSSEKQERKELLKSFGKSLAIFGSLLLVSASSLVVSFFGLIAGGFNNIPLALLFLAGLTGTVVFWHKTQSRIEVLKTLVTELSVITRLSKQDEREFKKYERKTK